VDISTKESHEEIVSECKMRAQPDAMARIALRGVPSFNVEQERLTASLKGHFFWVELEDESSFFESGDIARFAEEPTIRGYFVRRLLDRLEDSTSEREKEVLRLALRKGLAAFEGR
jgi:exonuclease SbcD